MSLGSEFPALAGVPPRQISRLQATLVQKKQVSSVVGFSVFLLSSCPAVRLPLPHLFLQAVRQRGRRRFAMSAAADRVVRPRRPTAEPEGSNTPAPFAPSPEQLLRIKVAQYFLSNPLVSRSELGTAIKGFAPSAGLAGISDSQCSVVFSVVVETLRHYDMDVRMLVPDRSSEEETMQEPVYGLVSLVDDDLAKLSTANYTSTHLEYFNAVVQEICRAQHARISLVDAYNARPKGMQSKEAQLVTEMLAADHWLELVQDPQRSRRSVGSAATLASSSRSLPPSASAGRDSPVYVALGKRSMLDLRQFLQTLLENEAADGAEEPVAAGTSPETALSRYVSNILERNQGAVF